MASIDRAVILAAGRGTRMRELTADLPKPMIRVKNKPVLLHIVEGLQSAGIKEFLVVIGYRGDVVQEYFGDGTCFGLRIKYTTQNRCHLQSIPEPRRRGNRLPPGTL